MPKSVKEMMNIEVQRCQVTPSRPSEVWWWWRYKGEKAVGKGMKERMKRWELHQTQHADKKKFQTQHCTWLLKFLIILPHHHHSPIIIFLPSLSSSFLHHHLPFWFGLTWCLPARWTLVFNVYCSLTLVSVTCAICTQPVTLEVGLRTIPSVVSLFRYLSSSCIVSRST